MRRSGGHCRCREGNMNELRAAAIVSGLEPFNRFSIDLSPALVSLAIHVFRSRSIMSAMDHGVQSGVVG